VGDEFEMFSLTHGVMLAIFAAGIPVVVRLGHRVRDDSDRARRTSRAYAVVLVAVTMTMQVVQLLPGEYDVDTSWPLNLCDFAWMVGAYALWTFNQTAASLTYYWGLVLSTQGLITPDLHADVGSPAFIGFWLMHYLIVWSAIYLVWGLGIRPSWAAYRIVVIVTAIWLVAVYVFNLAADTNYGFLNRKPSGDSLLDLAGPWPIYVLVEVVVVAGIWALMTWPWARGRRGGSGAAVAPVVYRG
jgi:hypothetical integral membrane protein (TIGR02206 family)